MGSRFAALLLVAIFVNTASALPLFGPPHGTPGPLAPACSLQVRQPAGAWSPVTAVARAESPTTYYDYYSVSAHTEFVEAFVSKVYMYSDSRTGALYLVTHHNIDDGGSSDATVDFDFASLPSGVGVVLSDDGGEMRMGANPEGQWHFWLNTDGGILGPFPTATEWSFSIAGTWGGPDPMTSWRYVDGPGNHVPLDMKKSLEIANACNDAPTAVAGGPYTGIEGSAVTFDASGSSDPDGDSLTYSWDWEGDGVFDDTTTLATTTHMWPDDYSGTVRLRVSDGDLASDSTASVTIANAPPALSVNPLEAVDEGGVLAVEVFAVDPGTDAIEVVWSLETLGSRSRTYPAGAGPTVVDDVEYWTVGDDGSFAVSVIADDGEGGSDRFDGTVSVGNLAPAISLQLQPERVGFALRIAGEKWHDVSVAVTDASGAEVASGSITREPGSPDEQLLDLGFADVTPGTALHARVRHTPEDDPVNGQPNGATPAWLILRYEDGNESRLHHTFTVMQPDTYLWEADLTAAIAGRGFRVAAVATDPGSDDLRFEWLLPDGAVITEVALNDGIAADPPKSPAGTFPFAAASTVRFAAGPGTWIITLHLYDDDGGHASADLTVTFP